MLKQATAEVEGNIPVIGNMGPTILSCKDGLYLPCSISNIKLNCLVDTGA